MMGSAGTVQRVGTTRFCFWGLSATAQLALSEVLDCKVPALGFRVRHPSLHATGSKQMLKATVSRIRGLRFADIV